MNGPKAVRAAVPYHVFIILAFVVASAPTATAHSDDAIERQITLEPRGQQAFEMKIHWHRVLGSVTSEGGPVALRLVHDATGNEEWRATPAERHDLNHLVRCCDGSTWTTYRLIVENTGDVPLDVSVDVRVMHDDFMVMVEQAESGIVTSALFFGAVGAAYAWRGHRNLDRTMELQSGHRHWRRALAVWSLLLILPTLIALPGMVRLGTGPFTGLVAGLSSLPPAPGLFGAVAYLGILIIILWFVMLHFWTGSMGRWSGANRRIVAGGLVLIAGVIAITVSLAIEYRALFIPLLWGVAFAGPVAFLAYDAARSLRDDATAQ